MKKKKKNLDINILYDEQAPGDYSANLASKCEIVVILCIARHVRHMK